MPISSNTAGTVSGAGILPSNQAPGASPYTYTNANAYVEDILIAVGTVTAVDFSRDGATWYATGVIAGSARLSPNDRLKVTYTVAPTITRVPR